MGKKGEKNKKSQEKILTNFYRYVMLNKHRQMEEVFFLCLNLT